MASLSFRQALRRATAVQAPLVSRSVARPLLPTRPFSDSAGDAAQRGGEPPFLSHLRADLKEAMRNRDEDRLSVIRGLLAETVNSQKTHLPIETDKHLIRLMRRTRLQSADAASDFMVQGRQDLAEKELRQMGILRQYEAATGIETMTRDEIKKVVETVMAAFIDPRDPSVIQAKQVDIMKSVERACSQKDAMKSDIVLEVNAAIKGKRLVGGNRSRY